MTRLQLQPARDPLLQLAEEAWVDRVRERRLEVERLGASVP